MDRRRFVKLSVSSAVAIAGGTWIAGCQSLNDENALSSENSEVANSVNPSSESHHSSLVVYYSHPETTEASNLDNLNEDEENSVVVIGGRILGNTHYVAEVIAREAEADLYRIEISHTYPVAHDQLIAQAQAELYEGFRPEIAPALPDFSQYDTIFFGYPIWWAQLPPAVSAFLEAVDMADKRVYLFNTHGGSGDAGTPETIKTLQVKAEISQNNFVVSRNDVAESESEIIEWFGALD